MFTRSLSRNYFIDLKSISGDWFLDNTDIGSKWLNVLVTATSN